MEYNRVFHFTIYIYCILEIFAFSTAFCENLTKHQLTKRTKPSKKNPEKCCVFYFSFVTLKFTSLIGFSINLSIHSES